MLNGLTGDTIQNVVSDTICNYPINLVISDKKIENYKCFSLDDMDSLLKLLDSYTTKHLVTNNEELLKKDDKSKKINFDEYKNILFNTFWCSSKITIVGREFLDAYFTIKKDHIGRSFAQKNKEEYEKGFRFLFNIHD